jgi:hypothetical protein
MPAHWCAPSAITGTALSMTLAVETTRDQLRDRVRCLLIDGHAAAGRVRGVSYGQGFTTRRAIHPTTLCSCLFWVLDRWRRAVHAY